VGRRAEGCACEGRALLARHLLATPLTLNLSFPLSPSCDTDLMNSLQQIKNDGTYNGLSQEGKTAVDQMSTIFTYKCGVGTLLCVRAGETRGDGRRRPLPHKPSLPCPSRPFSPSQTVATYNNLRAQYGK
jgi:hypothetical protein